MTQHQSSAATEQEITSIVSRLRNFAVWNNRHSHYEPVPLCKEAADLIERIRAVPQTLWQPIETAPRDEAILVSGGGILYPIVASWSGRDDESWRLDAEGNVHMELDRFPTHWMPLPSSPVTTDQPQTLPEPNGTENLKAILADQPYQNSGLSVYEINLILANDGGFMPDEAVLWFRENRGKFASSVTRPHHSTGETE